ncbi:hypothetical protein Tco_1539206, partial [Tanacetum coccineum]
NDPRDFAKPVKAISLPQDLSSTSDRHLIELENQVQCLMEAHLALMQPTQVNKITSSCEICSGPHDTQYCMENPEQAFVDYASLRTDGTRNIYQPTERLVLYLLVQYQTKLEKALIDFDPHQEKRLSSLKTQLGQQQDDMISKINLLWKTISEKLDDTPIRNTAGSLAAQMNFTNVESEEEFEEETEEEIKEEEEDSPKHFDIFPTMKFHYNWIMSKRLGPRRKPSKPRKICNFVGKVKGLKVFVGNFTYQCDFMVLEDTTSVIDYDLGLVIFGKPFVEATGLVYDKEEGTITFEKDKEKIMFKMPHKMEMFKHIDFTDIKTDHPYLLLS